MENEKESVKVLIVDDEQDIRTLLNIYLKRLGYDVVEAADASFEAMARFISFSMIPSGLTLPGSNPPCPGSMRIVNDFAASVVSKPSVDVRSCPVLVEVSCPAVWSAGRTINM